MSPVLRVKSKKNNKLYKNNQDRDLAVHCSLREKKENLYSPFPCVHIGQAHLTLMQYF